LSASGRLSTRILGQPFAIAASVCALMFGYLAALNTRRCTLDGRLHDVVTLAGGG
jgi:hypothetical protein